MRIVIILIRAGLCAMIALATFEMVARLDDRVMYGASLTAPYNELTIYRNDELGRIGKPYARYQKWKLNAIGYRGPDLQPGAIRIACLGASETFGVYESPDNEYPRQLERRLNSHGGAGNFEVVNASYPGMTIRTADLRVKYLVDHAHPRFALIYPSFAPYIWVPWLKNSAQPPPPPRFEVRIVARLTKIAASLTPESWKQWRRERALRQEAAAYQVMTALPDENIALFVGDLNRLLRDLRERGVKPILMTHATRFHEPLTAGERNHLSQWRIYFPMLEENGFLDMEHRMNDSVRDLAARTSTPLIDIDREMPREPKYFGDFVHFTDAGAAEMSRIIEAGLTPQLVN